MLPFVNNPLGTLQYRRLQYIESTGTQYIDTGVKPDYANGDSTFISYYRADYTGYQPCPFGSRETIYVNGFYVLMISMSANGQTGRTEIQWPSTAGKYTISVDDNNITVDGSILSAMPQRVTCTKNMFLFALNNYGTAAYGICSGMKLYDWKYYHNGVLAQHLIPAMDENDVPCMFDTITGTYYYNAGTGTFNYA